MNILARQVPKDFNLHKLKFTTVEEFQYFVEENILIPIRIITDLHPKSQNVSQKPQNNHNHHNSNKKKKHSSNSFIG